MDNTITSLADKISFMILQEGGAIAMGVADLSLAAKGIELHADPRLKRFERAISFAMPFPRSVIEELPDGPSHTYIYYYRAVNARIDDISIRITAALERLGYDAFPVPSSQRTGKGKLDSIFPHRIAAHLAGVGWIGKSGCLVNKDYGPRVRLGTILTNAPFSPNSPLTIGCGECTLCKDACPADAILGLTFSPDIPVEDRLIAERCDNYQNDVRSRFGKRVCGLCLAACPYGKSGNSVDSNQ